MKLAYKIVLVFSIAKTYSCDKLLPNLQKWSKCNDELMISLNKCFKLSELYSRYQCLHKLKTIADFSHITSTIKLTEKSFVFNVPSGGCTNEKHFILDFQKRKENVLDDLKIVRIL